MLCVLSVSPGHLLLYTASLVALIKPHLQCHFSVHCSPMSLIVLFIFSVTFSPLMLWPLPAPCPPLFLWYHSHSGLLPALGAEHVPSCFALPFPVDDLLMLQFSAQMLPTIRGKVSSSPAFGNPYHASSIVVRDGLAFVCLLSVLLEYMLLKQNH